MFPVIFLLFIVMPLLEIFVLIQVGSIIGGLNTILILVVTAVIGAALVRNQGMQAWQQAQQRMAVGEMPGLQLAEGILIFVSGLMFVTPGLITDVFAILLLMPFIRRPLAQKIMARMQVQVNTGGFQTFGFQNKGFQSRSGFQRPGQNPFEKQNDESGRTFEADSFDASDSIDEERRRLQNEADENYKKD
ncbi:protein affecting phage T7 exclusion by the F plasmid [Idiomarina sp. A28L]|uniref:FxsA family protein n=1 Tax=Idiomarina sp. A28L TaxID=1036674 RepID=UPI0002138A9B|nr:FxsA family protein [Idiomarina sp. A28L]EGN75321.1 protein affecting phage T7 exclusion by the F plasmid [Idiomarina sp. A28L]